MTKHEHELELWCTFHRAPVLRDLAAERAAGGLETLDPMGATGHTSFLVATCCAVPSCGLAVVFPQENFDLTTPIFRRQFERALDAAGWHLEKGARLDG